MKDIFYFGEKIEGYNQRVLNEREIRAGAGILFLFAIVSAMYTWLTTSLFLTKIFVVAFFIDFSIRVFINPKFSPVLILSRVIVSNQNVEYVGAPQKRFAWSLGIFISIVMGYVTIINQFSQNLILFLCVSCLVFLFFESAFGICIGCYFYKVFSKEKVENCPGGICEIHKKENIQKVNFFQIFILFLYLILVLIVGFGLYYITKPF